jgi:uncharacterized protein YgbK (DUF1537 family)
LSKILVIADDLSGAAEIAGAGWRFGLMSRLVREPIARVEEGLAVLDTDSRLLPAERAAQVIRDFIRQIRTEKLDLIYKKTDSVLRGPVRAEIESLLDTLKLDQSLLVPQNPSRGRTITRGVYRIDGVPLDETSFKDDPDHPAKTSVVTELLGSSSKITVGDASSGEELLGQARRITPGMLPAGGVEFFEANLTRLSLSASRSSLSCLPGATKLFVCGSASQQSHVLLAQFQARGRPVCPMPASVFRGNAPPETWANQLGAALEGSPEVLAVIDQPVDRTPGASARLQRALAETVAHVLVRRRIDTLLLEGGATASAVCRRMNWNNFDMEGELSDGAVIMRAGAAKQRIAIKPGSYLWPDSVWA